MAFPPSKWKESSPFDFKDYTRTEDKTALAKSIVKLVYLGCAETTDERATDLLKYLNSFADRIALAKELVNKDNFQEFSPFAVKVRETYQSGIVIIGKTHAIQGFGKRIVDAAPCIKESQNTYYSSSAPRQYYDKNTLVYMKLEQIEERDK